MRTISWSIVTGLALSLVGSEVMAAGAGAIARPAPKPSERPVRPVRPARPAEREVKEVEKAPESRDVRNKGEAQKVLLDGMDAANKGRALPRESNIEEVVVGGASKDPSMTGAYTIRSMLESIGGGKLTMAECGLRPTGNREAEVFDSLTAYTRKQLLDILADNSDLITGFDSLMAQATGLRTNVFESIRRVIGEPGGMGHSELAGLIKVLMVAKGEAEYLIERAKLSGKTLTADAFRNQVWDKVLDFLRRSGVEEESIRNFDEVCRFM